MATSRPRQGQHYHGLDKDSNLQSIRHIYVLHRYTTACRSDHTCTTKQLLCNEPSLGCSGADVTLSQPSLINLANHKSQQGCSSGHTMYILAHAHQTLNLLHRQSLQDVYFNLQDCFKHMLPKHPKLLQPRRCRATNAQPLSVSQLHFFLPATAAAPPAPAPAAGVTRRSSSSSTYWL